MKKALLLMLGIIVFALQAEYVPFKQAIELLQNAKAEDFPNSHEVHLINKMDHLDDQCKGYSIIETYKKILTDEGKRNNQLFFYDDLIYDSLLIEEIKLIKADGKVIGFDPKEFLTKTDPPGWSNIYSNNSKYWTGNIPDLAVGDIVF